MGDKEGKKIWDFMTENPKISLVIILSILGTIIFLTLKNDIKTSHFTIESKENSDQKGKNDSLPSREVCKNIKEIAMTTQNKLKNEINKSQDIDYEINLRYWKEKMNFINQADCNVVLEKKQQFLNYIERSDSLMSS